MTTLEKLKNNKMIAEFEGYKVNYGFKKTGVLMLGQHISEEKLAYHSSWDWLMPVVEKITCRNYNGQLEALSERVEDALLGRIGFGSRLETTYKAVVEFIKWYNKTK